MKVIGIDHFTVNVVDWEKSRHFYGTVLGLAPLPEADLGQVVLHYFSLPGGAKLELIEYRDDTGVFTGSPLEKGMARHLAFVVDDLQEMAGVLKRENLPITEGPGAIPALSVNYLLTRDPNGAELEFVQRI